MKTGRFFLRINLFWRVWGLSNHRPFDTLSACSGLTYGMLRREHFADGFAISSHFASLPARLAELQSLTLVLIYLPETNV